MNFNMQLPQLCGFAEFTTTGFVPAPEPRWLRRRGRALGEQPCAAARAMLTVPFQVQGQQQCLAAKEGSIPSNSQTEGFL